MSDEDETLFAQLKRSLSDRFSDRTRHQHILQPLLWLCGTFGIACVAATVKTTGLVQQEFIGGAAVCLLFTLGAYAYWSAKDPDRLQSERFRLSSRELSIIESRAIITKGGIIEDPLMLVVTENTSVVERVGARELTERIDAGFRLGAAEHSERE